MLANDTPGVVSTGSAGAEKKYAANWLLSPLAFMKNVRLAPHVVLSSSDIAEVPNVGDLSDIL